jgi:hypothetical protein
MTATSLTQNDSSSEKTPKLADSLPRIWHKSAPRAVREAYAIEQFPEGWTAWQKHLAKRSKPVDPEALLPGGSNALHWAMPGSEATFPEGDSPIFAAQVLGQSPGLPIFAPQQSGQSPQIALEVLWQCRLLPRLASELPPDQWWAMMDQMFAAVADAEAIPQEENPLVHQLLRGELALTLAYLFPEINPCRELGQVANRALSYGFQELLDGQGFPHARHLHLLRPLLACWTRCRSMRDGVPEGCWTPAAEEQYLWLIRNALRLTRPDGSVVLSSYPSSGNDMDLFIAATELSGKKSLLRIAKAVLPDYDTKSSKKLARKKSSPAAAVHSPWAAAAVLRTDWSRRGRRLTVVYPGNRVQLELSSGGDVLFSGAWGLHVRFNRELLSTISEWEQICWVSDDDVDYLELEINLSGGFRVQRHLMLAHEDHVVLLADSILGERAGAIDYRGVLPLASGVEYRGSEETQEGYLWTGKCRALVIPPALPEWRSDPKADDLVQVGAELELHQSFEGCRLFAPLWIDLDRRRSGKPLTWRQLTVAESLMVQPRDVAAGYRIQIGKRQWLLYRSLADPANRTLLGHNLSTEMLVARFDRSGEVEPLIEIE